MHMYQPKRQTKLTILPLAGSSLSAQGFHADACLYGSFHRVGTACLNWFQRMERALNTMKKEALFKLHKCMHGSKLCSKKKNLCKSPGGQIQQPSIHNSRCLILIDIFYPLILQQYTQQAQYQLNLHHEYKAQFGIIKGQKKELPCHLLNARSLELHCQKELNAEQ